MWFSEDSVVDGCAYTLFCFPYAGGGGHLYQDWMRCAGDSITIVPVAIPGRDRWIDRKPFCDVRPLVEELASAIAPFSGKRFGFFGHSMGALIGFELARELRTRGMAEPEDIFVSSASAPHLAVTRKSRNRHLLPDEEFLAEILRLNGTAGEVLRDAGMMRHFLPMLRADFEIIDGYTYSDEAPLDCNIVTFGGSEDDEVSLEHLEEWQAQTTGEFKMYVFSGGHFYIREEESQVLEHVLSSIDAGSNRGNFS